jgi:hypothetical protein
MNTDMPENVLLKKLTMNVSCIHEKTAKIYIYHGG